MAKKSRNAEEILQGKMSERLVHLAKLEDGTFTIEMARAIAADVAESDRNDPFIFARCVSSLMNGVHTPQDWADAQSRGQVAKKDREIDFGSLAKSWSELSFAGEMQRLVERA